MAWTTLDTNGLLPGEPWTSAKALAVYENVFGFAAGDSGAPKLQTAAIANSAVTLDKMASQSVSTVKMRAPSTATFDHMICTVQDAEVSGPTSGAPTDYLDTFLHTRFDAARHLGASCLIPGVYMAGFDIRFRGVGQTVARIIAQRSGGTWETIGEWSTTALDVWVFQFTGVSLGLGDRVVFQIRGTNSLTEFAWRRLRVWSQNPDFGVI